MSGFRLSGRLCARPSRRAVLIAGRAFVHPGGRELGRAAHLVVSDNSVHDGVNCRARAAGDPEAESHDTAPLGEGRRRGEPWTARSQGLTPVATVCGRWRALLEHQPIEAPELRHGLLVRDLHQLVHQLHAHPVFPLTQVAGALDVRRLACGPTEREPCAVARHLNGSSELGPSGNAVRKFQGTDS